MSNRRDRSTKRGAPRHQHNAAGPDFLKLGAIENFRARGDDVLHHCLVVGDLAEDGEAAVAQRQDDGQLGLDEARPIALGEPRLEAELLGGAQHLGDADRGRGEPVADLLGFDGNAVNAQHDHQASQT